MAAIPYNPVVPCVHQIPGGMFPGKIIRVNGSAAVMAHRFTINLQCGPNSDPSDDIALHLSIRFPEGTLVRNHFSGGAWGPEETDGRLPIIRGRPFTAVVHCEANSFRIVLDGMQFCTFDHRLPYQRVNHIRIDGDLMVTFIGFEVGQTAPPVQDLVVPCIHQIPGGMFPGKIIRVNGSTALGAHRFTINLQCGPNSDPSDDIALHLSIRFPEGTLVRNHFSGGAWGPEETAGWLPIIRGRPFTAVVHCEANSFKIVLDGVQFCTFDYRLPYQRVNHIRIDGDLMVTFIGFEVGQSAPPVQDLVVPCVHQIPGGIFPGKIIRVNGSTALGAHRFTINLQCGPNSDPSDDIALHLSIRFPEGTLVRNHFSGGAWGPEETDGHLPIIRGRPFTAVVHCEANSFRIVLDGVQFCTFDYRLPYQRVSHIRIDGDLMVTFIGFEVGQSAPPVQDLVAPYLRRIPGSFTPGRRIRITGSVPIEANRFIINLQCGPSSDSRDDIALHVDFRFLEGCVVRNHSSAVQWGPEETDGGLPINWGNSFDILISCEASLFKVIVNGAQFCTFIHRLPYQKITHIRIVGDVELKDLSFEGVQSMGGGR